MKIGHKDTHCAHSDTSVPAYLVHQVEVISLYYIVSLYLLYMVNRYDQHTKTAVTESFLQICLDYKLRNYS